MIKLSKEAPWDKVKIGDIIITKTKWIEENFDYRPIKKWVEFKKEELVQENEKSVDFSKLTKAELVKICKDRNIDTKGLTKINLIELLTKQ